MIAEVGNFALSMALLLALVQVFLPLLGAQFNIDRWMQIGQTAAQAQALFVLIAYLILTRLFVLDDFSVLYVANNSNVALPLYYKISAVWGAHEGSLLLWILILSGWTVAIVLWSHSLDARFKARVLAVMGLISVGFLMFTLLTSNPFERLFPPPDNGRDLNPLLQDFGLIVHPPLLYMGYVGFSVSFAFAISALIGGRLDPVWARQSRPWTLAAWVFLTAGITLGSWWAYHELGWGGWWFWDPVENASFMPWLVATALIHSLIIAEKRDAFKSWAVLLALLTFSLSLLGTFLVRSGILVSVHAFASDPARGIFILMFLGLVTGLALLLYAWRAPAIYSSGTFALFSRESFLLVNNVVLLTSAASILLATLYPLFMDILELGKISVGPPYFNRVFVPLCLPLVFLAAVAPFIQWKKAQASVFHNLSFPSIFLLAMLIGLIVVHWGYQDFQWLGFLGVTAGSWIVLMTLFYALRHYIQQQQRISSAVVGMALAHIGVGVFTLGVTLSSLYSTEREAFLTPGEQVKLASYTFHLRDVRQIQGPNYSALEAELEVRDSSQLIGVLRPQKRTYQVQTNPMTEAAIEKNAWRDLYVAMGEQGANEAWSMRVYYRPMVRWIWFGAVLMMLGGVFAIADQRYRRKRLQPNPVRNPSTKHLDPEQA